MQGQNVSPHKFTGKRFDDSSGLYYYGARYYDPELGRFTQPDTIVQAPSDPQTLNRYTYCRNNPLIFTDPSGHSFWKKFKSFFSTAVKIVATAVSIAIPVLAPAMMLLNAEIGLYEGIRSGAGIGSIFGGLAGGMIGGAVFGTLAKGLALGLSNQLGLGAATFFGGATVGSVEFGISGFGAGFGGALGSGASVSQALTAGGWGAAVGAGTGAMIEGSYMAGWQNTAHGLSRSEIAQSKYEGLMANGEYSEAGAYKTGMQSTYTNLSRGYAPIPALTAATGLPIPHTGITISQDPFGELNGSWGFNPAPSVSRIIGGSGATVPGAVTHDSFMVQFHMAFNVDQIKSVYSAIQSSIANPPNYNAFSYNCYSWRDEMLANANNN